MGRRLSPVSGSSTSFGSSPRYVTTWHEAGGAAVACHCLSKRSMTYLGDALGEFLVITIDLSQARRRVSSVGANNANKCRVAVLPRRLEPLVYRPHVLGELAENRLHARVGLLRRELHGSGRKKDEAENRWSQGAAAALSE